MSAAFGAGIKRNFSQAKVIYDKFHVSQLVQKAFDKVRKSVARKAQKRLNKWIFLKDPQSLSSEQAAQLDQLLHEYPILDKAYQMKNSFKLLWEQPNKEKGSAFLCFWTDCIKELHQKAFYKLAKTLNKFHQGIIQVFDSRLTNARLEGLNSIIQTMKRNARGYKDVENLKILIRLHCIN